MHISKLFYYAISSTHTSLLHHSALWSLHLLLLSTSGILSNLGDLRSFRLSLSAHNLLLFLGKSLLSLSLLDILFQFFIFLTTHVINLFFSELLHISEHALSLLLSFLRLPIKCSFNCLLPDTFKTLSALSSTLWFSDI